MHDFVLIDKIKYASPYRILSHLLKGKNKIKTKQLHLEVISIVILVCRNNYFFMFSLCFHAG